MKLRFPSSKHINTVLIASALLLLAALSNSAQAQLPESGISEKLESYLTLIAKSDSPTNPAIFQDASAYWLKGVHGNHLAVARFFVLHSPDDWHLEGTQSAGDYAAIEVAFGSVNYGQPWRARFELARTASGWQIAEFEDLTIRPFDEVGADPGKLVMAYLGIMQTIIRSDDSAEPETAQRIKQFYQPGAGFWRGYAVNAVPLYLWLEQQTPAQPSLVSIEANDPSSVVTVRFATTKRENTPAFIKLSVEEVQNRLFITGYENMAASQLKAAQAEVKAASLAAVNSTQVSAESPEALVRSQLAMLQQAGPGMPLVMSELVERSEPLWISSKTARASLGRLIGVFSGLASLENSPAWELDSSSATNPATVTARLSNPDELGAYSALLKGVRFEVVQQPAGWKLSSATPYR